jgi:hypothetical protein
MTVVVNGAPRTKKNHGRVERRGKRIVHLPSLAFTKWEAIAKPQLRLAWAEYQPIEWPVNVRAHFYRDALTGDAVGYYQALADVLQAACVVTDDKYIVSWDGSRLLKDAERPRVELVITDGETAL